MFQFNRLVGAEREVEKGTGKTSVRGVIKFGKYKNRYIDDVLEVEKRYIEDFMLGGGIDDLPDDVRAYLKLAVELEGDPLRLDPNRAPPAITKDRGAEKVGALKAKLKGQLKEKKNADEAKKAAGILEKRKDDAEW